MSFLTARRRPMPVAGPFPRGLFLAGVLLMMATPPLSAAPSEYIPKDLTPEAMKAIKRGLAWLAKAQRKDGSWAYRRFGNSSGGHVGITGLAGIAFLAGGNVPGRGKYGENVERAIRYVIKCTHPRTGYINSGNTRMYSHGFATLFLAEVYGMTRREDVRGPLIRAINLIENCQNPQGGWRYHPTPTDADIVALSVFTPAATRAMELADTFREMGHTVVAGGIFATGMPDELAPHVDAVVTGEGEGVWPRLLADFAAGRLAPRYQEEAPFPLDQLPLPDLSLYFSQEGGDFHPDDYPLQISRGCSLSCHACMLPAVMGRKQRPLPMSHIIGQFQQLRDAGKRANLTEDTSWFPGRAGRTLLATFFDHVISTNQRLLISYVGISMPLLLVTPRRFLDKAKAAGVDMFYLVGGFDPITMKAFTGQDLLHGRVKALHAERTFPESAQNAEPLKQGEDLFRGPGLQVRAVALQDRLRQVPLERAVGSGPVPPDIGISPVAEDVQRRRIVSPVDGPAQGADAAFGAEPVALPELHHAVPDGRSFAIPRVRKPFPGDLPIGFAEGPGKPVKPAGIADVSQHGPGFHRCQLVPVPHKDQAGTGGEGLYQLGHEGQVHHGGLVHRHHVRGEGIVRVVPEIG